MPEFFCDLDLPPAPLAHSWEHTVGSDRALVALRADWQAQLARAHRELGFRHVRFHGLLSDEMGTLIVQDDRLMDSFFNADQIVDYLLAIGMRPFVELSFMPTTLASGKRTVFKYRGNVTPPRDPGEWADLIRRLARHWVDRYGREELREWYFEVWNEPNLKAFWTGSRARYFALYRATAEALKSVDAGLRVGGPASAQNAWIPEFLNFCRREGVPVDFVSTHTYPTDAFGQPDDDGEGQLAAARRGVLAERAQDARRQAGDCPLYYTEWNTSSNSRDPLHDEPYAAAFIVKTVLEVANLVQGYSFWTFSDIFEENYFPSQPFHGGFGLLTLHGIAKPSYRAFELLHALGQERFLVDGRHPTVDAWVIGRGSSLAAVLTNHALPRHPIASERVRLRLGPAPEPRIARVWRIDEDHANAARRWRALGAPEYLSAEQVAELEAASALTAADISWRHLDGALELELDLPPHGVAAITLEFDGRPAPREFTIGAGAGQGA
jgi:xylan 1,4-beta-xylosidase